MARLSAKVKNWSPSKGKVNSEMSIYDAYQHNKDTLFDLHVQHKTWGNEWYELVKYGSYANAKLILAVHGKGSALPIALMVIDDLSYLDALLNGGDR